MLPALKPVTEIKRHATEIIEQLRTDRVPVLITEHGKEAAVMLDVATYKGMLHRLELLEVIAHVAAQLFAKAMETIEHAAAFPEMARYIPELGHTYRELLSVRPFRIIYRISGKELWVIGGMRMEQDFAPERFINN